MGRWLAIAAACAALMAASAAQGQERAATPEQIAAAHAAADSIIGRSGVADLFENVTSGAEPKIRHRASGMLCYFGADPTQWRRDDVSVFPSGLPRGEDVGCNIWVKTFLISMDVTRFQPVPSLEQATTAYEGSVMRLHPNARHHTGRGHEVSAPQGLPPWRTVRYVFDDRGGQFSRLSVSVVNGWVIEQRTTGPLNDADFGDLASSVQLLAAIVSVSQ